MPGVNASVRGRNPAIISATSSPTLRLFMRTRYLAWIPLVGLSVSLAFAGPGERLYERGRAEFLAAKSMTDVNARRKKLKRAVSDLRKFTDLYPANSKRADAFFDLGSAYEVLANLAPDRNVDREAAVRALGYYRKLVQESPRNRLAGDALSRIAEICSDVFKDAVCADEARAKIRGQYADGNMVHRLSPAVAPAVQPEVVTTKTDPASPAVADVPGPSEVAPSAKVELTDVKVEKLSTEIVIRLPAGEPKSIHSDHLAADPEARLPERFYVDLEEVRIPPTLKAPEFLESDPVTQLRFGRNGTAARVVLDLRAGTNATHVSAEWKDGELRIRVPMPVPQTQEVAVSKTLPATEARAPKLEKPEKPATEAKTPVRKNSRPRIVLDAGHGGDDTGAIGRKGTQEKDVCLAIVKRVHEILKKRAEYEVYLTRSDDRFVPLSDRTKYANQVGGDLFISVHANAAPRKTAAGISTYFLDNHDDEESLRVALRENGVPGGVPPPGKIPESEDQYLEIMKASMVKNFHTVQSTELAHNVQGALLQELRRRYSGVDDLGVRSARFYVLTGATMPAVLVETSFISNVKEEKRLKDAEYQQAVAQAIVRGIDRFFKSSVGRGDHAALYQN